MIKLLAFLRRDVHADIDTLSAEADGSLDRGRAAALGVHLASCGVCVRRLEELRVVRSALAAMPEVEPPRSFRLRQSDVEAVERSRANSGASRVLGLMPAVSAVAVVLFAVLVAVDALPGGGASDSRSATKLTAAPSVAERSDGALAFAPTPQAAADEAAGGQQSAPSVGSAEVQPRQTVPEGTFPAAAASDTATAPSAKAAQPQPTGAPFSDARAEGGAGGESDGYSGLRIAEAILAAIAIGAGVAAVSGWTRS